LIVALTAVMMLSYGSKAPLNDDNALSGQAHHATSAVHIAPDTDSLTSRTVTEEGNEDYGHESTPYPPSDETISSYTAGTHNRNDEIQDNVNRATAALKQVEEQELVKESSLLESALVMAGNMIRLGIGKLLGDSVDTEEMEQLAREVDQKLQIEMKGALEQSAQDLVQQEVETFSSTIAKDQMEGMETESIEEDLWEREATAEEHVRQGMEQAAQNLSSGLRGRAILIEKEILEQRLSERLGQPVKLLLQGDQIVGSNQWNTTNGFDRSNSVASFSKFNGGFQNQLNAGEFGNTHRDPTSYSFGTNSGQNNNGYDSNIGFQSGNANSLFDNDSTTGGRSQSGSTSTNTGSFPNFDHTFRNQDEYKFNDSSNPLAPSNSQYGNTILKQDFTGAFESEGALDSTSSRESGISSSETGNGSERFTQNDEDSEEDSTSNVDVDSNADIASDYSSSGEEGAPASNEVIVSKTGGLKRSRWFGKKENTR
jgi:hypothetical protein